MTDRTNPYNRLRDECRAWARTVLYPRRISMWVYDTEGLRDLDRRTAAAQQLGYVVQLTAQDDGKLAVVYVKKHDDPPWSIRT